MKRGPTRAGPTREDEDYIVAVKATIAAGRIASRFLALDRYGCT